MTTTLRTEPRLLRRVAPAVGLFLLAPLVAEFLLGNLPITLLPALVGLAPMYGGGALLIREVTRRAGRGVPTMLVLGVAYGLVEEGVTTQSLFNPDYAGLRLLDDGFVPGLGIGLPWTLFVLSLHAVWSTTAPIVVMEACVPGRRTTAWLRTPGLVVTGVLFLAGIAATTAVTLRTDPFVAPLPQPAGAVVLAALLAVLAFRLPRTGSGAAGSVPHPVATGVVGLAAGAAFMLADDLPGWAFLATVLVLDVVLALAVRRWSARAAWSGRHTLALGAAALLTYAWHSFPESPIVPVSATVDLVGNAVFAAAAVALIAVAAVRSHPARTSAG